jgi:hypothetical protein
VYAQRLFQGSCWYGCHRHNQRFSIRSCTLNGVIAVALSMEWSMCPPLPQILRPRPVVFIHDAGAMGLGSKAMMPPRLPSKMLLSSCGYTAGLSTETRIPPRLPPRLLLMPAVSSLMVASCAWEQKQWFNLNCHSSCSSISAVSYTIKCTSRLRTETRIPPPLPPEMLLALRCCYHPGQATPLPKSSVGTSFSARQAWTRTSCCLFQ